MFWASSPSWSFMFWTSSRTSCRRDVTASLVAAFTSPPSWSLIYLASSWNSCRRDCTSSVAAFISPPSWSLISLASSLSSRLKNCTSSVVVFPSSPSWSLMFWASWLIHWTSFLVVFSSSTSWFLMPWASSWKVVSKVFPFSSIVLWMSWIEELSFTTNSLISISFLYQCSNSFTFLSSSAVRGSFKSLSMASSHSVPFVELIDLEILNRASLISCQSNWNSSSLISMRWFTWPYTVFR